MSRSIIVVGASTKIKQALEHLDVEFRDEMPKEMPIKRGPDLSDLPDAVLTPPIEERPFRQRSKKAPRKW